MTEELPLCECGCGNPVTKIGNKFILGHNGRKTLWSLEPEALPCECGCGELAKPGNRFINGHSMKGKSHSPAHCAAMSKARRNSDAVKSHNESMRGILRSPETCAANSKAHTGVPLSPGHIAAISRGCNKMRGGDDIVEHHYIYDEFDLSLNTVQMTRSDHTSLHNLLRKLGYKVPHINVKGVK